MKICGKQLNKEDVVCTRQANSYSIRTWWFFSFYQASVLVQSCVGLFQDRIHHVHDGLPAHINIFGIFKSRRFDTTSLCCGCKESRGQLEDSGGFFVEMLGCIGVNGSLEAKILGGNPIDALDCRNERFLNALL